MITSWADMSPETRARIDWLFANGEYNLPDRLRPDCHKDGHTYDAVYERLQWNDPSGTIAPTRPRRRRCDLQRTVRCVSRR